MEQSKNGTNKSIIRRCDQRIGQNQQERLGTTGCDCSSYGAEEQSESVESDRTRGYSIGSSVIKGDTPAGKILQRLDQLESTYYQYVHSHQGRLQARLDESKALEEQFQREAAELRREIFELATQESTNGNGHRS